MAYLADWRRRAFVLALALSVAVAAYFDTFAELAGIWWESAAYNHCILIIPISLYLIWLKRHVLLNIAPGSSMSGIVFIGAAGLLWLVGDLMLINFFQHAAAVAVLIGTVWALTGNAVAYKILFPLAYLFFLVPEGEFLVPYLQDWTATVLVFLLRVTDIPVFLEGRYLQIPSGHFEVARACSGINYLIATLAVGTVYAYLQYRSVWRRLAFMSLAIAVPLLANGMRAYGIVMIAHLSDYKYAMGIDHFIYGWFFFGLVIFILFSVGALFSDVSGGEQESVPEPEPSEPPRASAAFPPGAVLAVVLIVAPHYAAAHMESKPLPEQDYSLPVIPGWAGPSSPAYTLGGKFSGEQQHLAAEYKGPNDERVSVEAAIYLRQSQGREFVNQGNSIYDPETWRLVFSETTQETGLALVPRVHVRKLRDRQEHRLVWWWYQIGPRNTTSAVAAKLTEAYDRMTGNMAGGMVVLLSAGVLNDDYDDAEHQLKSFMGAIRESGLKLPIRGN